MLYNQNNDLYTIRITFAYCTVLGGKFLRISQQNKLAEGLAPGLSVGGTTRRIRKPLRVQHVCLQNHAKIPLTRTASVTASLQGLHVVVYS